MFAQRHAIVHVVLCAYLCVGSSPLAHATAAADSALATINDAVPAHQRAQALLSMARLAMGSDPLAAHVHSVNALAVAERTGDALLEHQALRSMAQAEENMGDFSEFMKNSLRALRLSQSLGDPQLLSRDLQLLSTSYRLNHMMDRAVDEARNALAMLLPTQDNAGIAEAQRFLILSLMEADRHEEVRTLAEVCLKKARVKEDDLEEARLLSLIGRDLILDQRAHDALPYLTKAGRTLAEKGTAAELFMLATDKTAAYIQLHLISSAKEDLKSAHELVAGCDTWNNRFRLLELSYDLAVSQEHWQDALGMHKRIKQQVDSLNISRQDAQLARMQISYQLDRKEEDNAQLRVQNARSVEMIAGEQLNNRFLLGSLLILLVLVTALFLTSRHSIRMVKRMRLKNEVIRKQHDEIHTKNLELQRQNMRLAETLISEEEKEMMIKEIHHRVKNNLQVVDSLLHIQGIAMNDPKVDRMMREAQGRIRSMALVHEHMYRSAGAPDGNLQQHLEQLTRNILVAYGVHDRISVSVDAPFPVFDSETLMPLTLAVNELFTNAVKYAFPNEDTGRINIVIRTVGSSYELLFSDDGVGLGLDDTTSTERSFGIELVRMLAGQLNGEVRFLKGQGTTVSLTFSPEVKMMRVAS